MLVRARSDGCGVTVTVAERWLLAALSSVSVWIATRVCPPGAAAVVFQLKESVERAPTARPVTVCVPSVTPAVWSVRTTSKPAVTFCPPTFWTVTPTATVVPWVTALGALTLLTATSVTGAGFTVIAIAMASLLELLSASICVAISVCPLTAAPAVFQGISTVVVAPAVRPATGREPTGTPPADPSVRTTLKLVPTSVPPTF